MSDSDSKSSMSRRRRHTFTPFGQETGGPSGSAAAPERWTEEMLRALEPHEHDFQEFKGAGWMTRPDGEIHANFLYYLSKQVSAFVNGAGGRVFIGINDEGDIDGGVPRNLRGGTREWLEDLVPSCVEPMLGRCNVFEVVGDNEGTAILRDRAVYVIDLPASDEAPHQAKDHRYYLRIAGKSRPMGHVHVQDVLRRSRQPAVTLTRIGPYGEPVLDLGDPRGPQALIQFRAFFANQSRTLAHHVGVEVHLARALAGRVVRRRMREQGETHLTQSPGNITFFRYHPVPLFPTQEVYALSFWIRIHRNNLGLVAEGCPLEWTVFADDSVPATGTKPLWEHQVVQRAHHWVSQQLNADD